MDTNKMRSEFEAAFVAKYGFGRLTASANADAHAIYEAAKWAWQASREAVVVELPDVANYEVYDQQHDFLHTDEVTLMEAVRSAIEAQGLKVAP